MGAKENSAAAAASIRKADFAPSVFNMTFVHLSGRISSNLSNSYPSNKHINDPVASGSIE